MSTPLNQFTPDQEAWLQLLESGKHKQGRLRLKQSKGEGVCYCCLGLACEFVLKLPNGPSVVNPDSFEFTGPLNRFEQSVLPYIDDEYTAPMEFYGAAGDIAPEFREGFSDAMRKAGFLHVNLWSSLAEYNDHEATFAQIAAAIRAMPWAVFKNFKAP